MVEFSSIKEFQILIMIIGRTFPGSLICLVNFLNALKLIKSIEIIFTSMKSIGKELALLDGVLKNYGSIMKNHGKQLRKAGTELLKVGGIFSNSYHLAFTYV